MAFCNCSIFSSKPALPRPSANLPNESRPSDRFAAAVQTTDIVYVPIDKGGTENEATAGKMVEAFQRSGTSFCIAWENIEADQQSLLDQIRQNPATLEQAFGALEGRPGLRARSAAILRATVSLPQLALGAPAMLLMKLRSGETLNDAERATLPRDFRAPSDGLENFAERLATVRGLRERQIARLYRMHLVAVQFAAEKIVEYCRAHPGTKVLAFMDKRDLSGDGISFYVAQKIDLRQLNFEHVSPREKSRLLTRSRNRAGFLAAR